MLYGHITGELDLSAEEDEGHMTTELVQCVFHAYSIEYEYSRSPPQTILCAALLGKATPSYSALHANISQRGYHRELCSPVHNGKRAVTHALSGCSPGLEVFALAPASSGAICYRYLTGTSRGAGALQMAVGMDLVHISCHVSTFTHDISTARSFVHSSHTTVCLG